MALASSPAAALRGLSAESGTLPGGFPFVRVGDADRTLAVLPGVGDAMFPGRYPPGSGAVLAAYFGRYLDSHSVLLVSRPRGLPEDYDVETSADDHARALADRGPVDVLGISMGGLVGQQLAVRHPDLVDRLVVASSACRLGEAGREPVRRMLERARERDWAAVRAELAGGMFADWRRVAYPALAETVGRFVQPRPADPRDVVGSLSAILEYDGCEDLGTVEAPTLVVGGDRDPYFPADVMRETAAAVPTAELSLIDGGRHAAFHECKCTFDRRVARFLGARPRTPFRAPPAE